MTGFPIDPNAPSLEFHTTASNPEPPSGALSARQSSPQASGGAADRQDAHDGAEGAQGGSALLRAHVALAEQAGRDQAALKRLRQRVQAVADEARGSIRDWLVDALADLPDPRTPAAHGDGPSVAECAKADRVWPLQKGGE